MHAANARWLTALASAYPEHFHRACVLEVGSRIWSPPPHDSIRPYFSDCLYIGVDRVAGPGVDLVVTGGRAPELDALRRMLLVEVDTLAIFSVFEHDPDWAVTLGYYAGFLREGGLLVTCFGAEGNQHHEPEPWWPVPHATFLERCRALGFDILDAFFEEDRFGRECPGAYDVLARKGPQ